MANKRVYDIKSYIPSQLDSFIIDNNVWMFLFCPIGNSNKFKQRTYSKFIEFAKRNSSGLFINSLIVSEFFNSYLRLDFEVWKKEANNYTANYKNDYVGRERYIDTIFEIKQSLKNIMSLCEKMPDDFTSINFPNIIARTDQIDFNDSYYIEMANKSNLKIVTDDKDFQKFSEKVDIITLI